MFKTGESACEARRELWEQRRAREAQMKEAQRQEGQGRVAPLAVVRDRAQGFGDGIPALGTHPCFDSLIDHPGWISHICDFRNGLDTVRPSPRPALRPATLFNGPPIRRGSLLSDRTRAAAEGGAGRSARTAAAA